MSRKHDFYMIAGLALVVGYANLVGPHKLVEQLFPDGEFVVSVLVRSLVNQHPFRALATMELPVLPAAGPAAPRMSVKPGAVQRLPPPALPKTAL